MCYNTATRQLFTCLKLDVYFNVLPIFKQVLQATGIKDRLDKVNGIHENHLHVMF